MYRSSGCNKNNSVIMILQHSSCQVFSHFETLHFMSSLVFVRPLNHAIHWVTIVKL